MAAEAWAFHTLVALEVGDQAGYAQYRAAMFPILERYGGGFSYDFEVGKLLKAPTDAKLNRVFVISFPSAEASQRFFADPAYLAVRQQHFEPAVRVTQKVADWEA
ncbi:MAG: DUF1330 domain-containing protein [Polyangiaceae bacterium]